MSRQLKVKKQTLGRKIARLIIKFNNAIINITIGLSVILLILYLIVWSRS